MTRVGALVQGARSKAAGLARRRAASPAGPAAPPAGWVTGPPDVVGVGVQKAGTTSWWELLVQHPDLHPCAFGVKETHFFERHCTGEWSDADTARYHELFPRPPGSLAGEWTPRYVSDVWTPPLLRRAAPDATLLLMLRDPVERFRSGLDHIRGLGLAVDAGHVEQAVLRGEYGAQLRYLRRHFPAAQIVVLQHERCLAEPAVELDRTLRAVGLDPARHPGTSAGRHNITRKVHGLSADLSGWLQQRYEDDVRALLDLTDDIDVGLWPSFAHLRP